MNAHLEHPEERNPSSTSKSGGSTQIRWQRIIEIVGTACEMDASVREAYISEQCSGEDSLRLEVENLLREVGNSSALLQSGAGAPCYSRSPALEPGTLLDRYRIEQKIGESGMGVVYRAVDERLKGVVALRSFGFVCSIRCIGSICFGKHRSRPP